MTDWRGSFTAVDWGTTNRRAYALSADGEVQAEFEDNHGVSTIAQGAFQTAVAELRARLSGAPMLLAGMVGSNRGWAEAPYVPVPARLEDLRTALLWMADDIAIIPGVCGTPARPDVMRGEEVQVFGALALGAVAQEGRVCHPGTHAKWITIQGGALTDFRTAMTGEIFALLGKHSMLQLQGEVAADAPFLDGVDMILGGEPVLDALFSVRSRVVLGRLAPADTASFASGVLIGADVLTHSRPGETVALLGRPDLCALYGTALARRGCATTTTDGAAAFVAGMDALRRLIA